MILLLFIAADWWFRYGNSSPIVRSLAIQILSQTASSSKCERNWNTFALIYTKQRNCLAHVKLEQLVFCYYNIKLKLRDLEAERDKVEETEFVDLLEIAVHPNDDNEDPLYQWFRPTHLDDDGG